MNTKKQRLSEVTTNIKYIMRLIANASKSYIIITLALSFTALIDTIAMELGFSKIVFDSMEYAQALWNVAINNTRDFFTEHDSGFAPYCLQSQVPAEGKASHHRLYALVYIRKGFAAQYCLL